MVATLGTLLKPGCNAPKQPNSQFMRALVFFFITTRTSSLIWLWVYFQLMQFDDILFVSSQPEMFLLELRMLVMKQFDL